MPGLSINISDKVTPALDHMEATLRERMAINRQIGIAVVNLCKQYVAGYRGSRHASADKLGAEPTDFVGASLEAIHYQADATTILVDFTHPWFAAVGHDVHIKPGPGKKYLTIPIGKEAYGVRLQGQTGGKFFKGPRGGLFWGKPYPGNDKFLQPLYVLVPFVDQKQDRTRLPTDQEILDCVTDAALHELQDILKFTES
jgi:hypothetical protein